MCLRCHFPPQTECSLQFQGGNGSSPVRGLPSARRSPQNSHSAPGSIVSRRRRRALLDHEQRLLKLCSLCVTATFDKESLQIRQNSSSPTGLCFGEPNPKASSSKCVQVMSCMHEEMKARHPSYLRSPTTRPPLCVCITQTELTGLKLAALESNKSLDLEKKEGRIDDLLRVGLLSVHLEAQPCACKATTLHGFPF